MGWNKKTRRQDKQKTTIKRRYKTRDELDVDKSRGACDIKYKEQALKTERARNKWVVIWSRRYGV